jgi:hypothetical protein
MKTIGLAIAALALVGLTGCVIEPYHAHGYGPPPPAFSHAGYGYGHAHYY